MGHEHGDGHDHGDGDRHHFDVRAATWDDDPGKAERAARVADAIRRAVPLDTSVRLLEFGAGTGLLTQALRDDVGPVTLTDTSAGMRQVMQDKIAAGAIADARVWDLDLASRLTRAGYLDVKVSDCTDVQRDNGTFPLFLAVATR